MVDPLVATVLTILDPGQTQAVQVCSPKGYPMITPHPQPCLDVDALCASTVVHYAVGMLASHHQADCCHALELLRRYARIVQRSLECVADDIYDRRIALDAITER